MQQQAYSPEEPEWDLLDNSINLNLNAGLGCPHVDVKHEMRVCSMPVYGRERCKCFYSVEKVDKPVKEEMVRQLSFANGVSLDEALEKFDAIQGLCSREPPKGRKQYRSFSI